MGDFKHFRVLKEIALIARVGLGFVCLFFIVCRGSAFEGAEMDEGSKMDLASDSIRIDGRLIHVEAQIRIDSISNGSKPASPMHRAYSFGIQGVVLRSAGIVSDGMSTREWTGVSDGMHSVQLSLLQFPTQILDRSSRIQAMQFEMNAGLGVSRFATLDASVLPESVIGFLSSKRDGQFAAVTYEVFPIGIETDTLLLQAERSQVPFVLILGGWSATLKSGWTVSAWAGGKKNLKESSRLAFEKPNLNAEAPWHVVGMPSTWQSLIQIESGFVFPSSPQQLRSFEIIGQVVFCDWQWRLPWMGLGLRLN